ncbi:ABC transporter permease [Ornithinibacillus sp. BX22]|uniref:ABC transporter permease n=1 Tax=Ornithinibacillus hominis TaxID=2763055 RepID=A0A923L561_9BACI|nr:ABC transporter permease [Ornithinibacillus hominis]MBC5636616.1 ABC transporter permease [Ornithinibacillus hominis]
MNKFWIMTTHTYLSKLKTKVFFISTALILAFLVLLVNFESIILTFAGEDEDKIAVLDESGELFDLMIIQENNDELILEPFIQSLEEGKALVSDGSYDALITLDLNQEGLPEATFYAKNMSDSQLQTKVQQQLQQLKTTLATAQLGIDQVAINEVFSPIAMDTVALNESGKSAEEMNQARGIVYVMLILLYIGVIMYGSLIATDVATEKSSRVMELLVSSVSPITHMFAKIIGIALLGLTQIFIFVSLAYMMLQAKGEQLSEFLGSFGLQDASLTILLYGILFYLLGYLLYATLAAMLGSLVSRVEEANQMVTPIILLIAVAFFLAMFGMNVPESSIVTITSFIPFFAPMLMFIRVGILDIPIWEVFLSVGILIGTIILFAIVGAKVYKGGVLMYGKSSSFKDIKKAILLTRKE